MPGRCCLSRRPPVSVTVTMSSIRTRTGSVGRCPVRWRSTCRARAAAPRPRPCMAARGWSPRSPCPVPLGHRRNPDRIRLRRTFGLLRRVVPVPQDSGRVSGNYRRPKRLNRRLRRVFYLAALSSLPRRRLLPHLLRQNAANDSSTPKPCSPSLADSSTCSGHCCATAGCSPQPRQHRSPRRLDTIIEIPFRRTTVGAGEDGMVIRLGVNRAAAPGPWREPRGRPRPRRHPAGTARAAGGPPRCRGRVPTAPGAGG
jgi:hypothetical protein